MNVRETRLATLIAHLLILISTFTLLPYPLQWIPTSVLHGLFLYMALTSLAGNEMFERLLLLITEQVMFDSNLLTKFIRSGNRIVMIDEICLLQKWIKLIQIFLNLIKFSYINKFHLINMCINYVSEFLICDFYKKKFQEIFESKGERFSASLSTNSLHQESSSAKSTLIYCLSACTAFITLRIRIFTLSIHWNGFPYCLFLLLTNQVIQLLSLFQWYPKTYKFF